VANTLVYVPPLVAPLPDEEPRSECLPRVLAGRSSGDPAAVEGRSLETEGGSAVTSDKPRRCWYKGRSNEDAPCRVVFRCPLNGMSIDETDSFLDSFDICLQC
jgi:hypothetical protein